MGLLIVSNTFLGREEDAELLFTAFDWLKHECKATYKEITNPIDKLNNNMRFLIEGEGIPKGAKQFVLRCTTITKNILAFNIE